MRVKYIFGCFVFIVYSMGGFGQKPAIDSSVLGKWPEINAAFISNNGQYVMYSVDQPFSNSTSIIQATRMNWKMEISNFRPVGFSADNRTAIIANTDSIGIISLNRHLIEYVPNIQSFQFPMENKRGWLAYQLKNLNRELVLLNLISKEKRRFNDVSRYLLSSHCNVVIIVTDSVQNRLIKSTLRWLDLNTGEMSTIWEGLTIGDTVFDKTDTQLAFISPVQMADPTSNQIWYYEAGLSKAVVLANNNSKGLNKPFTIADEGLTFSKDGNRIFLTLQKEVVEPSKKLEFSAVDIWNYKDEFLQSQQLENYFITNDKSKFRAVISRVEKKIVLLENEKVDILSDVQGLGNSNFLLGLGKFEPNSYYNKSSYLSIYLISANDGKIEKINGRGIYGFISLSPEEKYVVWFDKDSLCYFSYDINARIIRNISISIPFPLYDIESAATSKTIPFGIAGWIKQDKSILIYDNYDVWKVDPSGMSLPVNITGGFGRRGRIVFGVASKRIANQQESIDSRENLLLAEFNSVNKDNGFSTVGLNSGNRLHNGSMEAFAYCIPRVERVGNGVEYSRGFEPIKANNSDYWLVKRMSAKDYPNLYLTKDFKYFKPMSNVHPESKYNWMTTELVNWKMDDNRTAQGILYKPEDFDSRKKYPVIFNYYEKKSDGLNDYLVPDFASYSIDIPSYVSAGYLVFVPDIYYPKGHNGKGVLNSIISAAHYLSTFSWVDSTKLGLEGHSFGGWETNFIITHSHLFAAASEGEGVADLISNYGEVHLKSGGDNHEYYEAGGNATPYGIGTTPWIRPDLYIENSPIFYIDKIITPLLMMDNKEDDAVSFSQGIEMFTAMKRAGKKVWMLQYDHEGHQLSQEQNERDYTIRMQQFFDYYLKGALAPKWMTEGVPARLKGIESGLELDRSSREP